MQTLLLFLTNVTQIYSRVPCVIFAYYVDGRATRKRNGKKSTAVCETQTFEFERKETRNKTEWNSLHFEKTKCSTADDGWWTRTPFFLYSRVLFYYFSRYFFYSAKRKEKNIAHIMVFSPRLSFFLEKDTYKNGRQCVNIVS